jgi:hypothetical protein
MLPMHGAVSNGAIHTSCGPKQPRWKIPWRRGVRRHAIQPRRHRGGRRAKGSDRELISNTVYFVLNFTKKAIFVVFYHLDSPLLLDRRNMCRTSPPRWEASTHTESTHSARRLFLWLLSKNEQLTTLEEKLPTFDFPKNLIPVKSQYLTGFSSFS